MTEQNARDLGGALTALGLEDRFLASREITKYPLAERGKIVNGIIAEKLKKGDWEGAIRNLYGCSLEVGLLYEGDKDQLKDSIVRSAREHPKTSGIDSDIVGFLLNAGEEDLLFRLAINIPSLNYKSFLEVNGRISSDYFSNATEAGNQRKQIVRKIAAEKAMNEGDRRVAFNNFKVNGDNDGIERVFKDVLRQGPDDLLVEIASSDPSLTSKRMKRVILSSIYERESRLSPISAYRLYKKYEVKLTRSERKALQSRVAIKASRNEIFIDDFAKEPEIRLQWAKRHAKDQPKTAYMIFKEQKYNGDQVITSVLSGLRRDMSLDPTRELRVDDIDEKHLKEAYRHAPFSVKADIALRLNDKKELKSLSRKAYETGNLEKAYQFWIKGGGELDGDYIRKIRKVLIKRDIREVNGYMFFLDKSDNIGKIEAYVSLMRSANKKRVNYARACDIAIELKDEEKMQRARVAMVEHSPSWAIRYFQNISEEEHIKGSEYILGWVASRFGVTQDELKGLVGKLQRD